jgi:hypothetical protein
MLPLEDPLLTRMNPFDVKIWIGGCCAPHTNTSEEPTLTVPKLVLPEPENRRNTGPLAGTAGTGLEPDAVEVDDLALVAFAAVDPDCAPDAVFDVLVEPPVVVAVDAVVETTVCVEVLDELPPQPASATTSSSANGAIAPNTLKFLLRGKLMCNQPRRRAY